MCIFPWRTYGHWPTLWIFKSFATNKMDLLWYFSEGYASICCRDLFTIYNLYRDIFLKYVSHTKKEKVNKFGKGDFSKGRRLVSIWGSVYIPTSKIDINIPWTWTRSFTVKKNHIDPSCYFFYEDNDYWLLHTLLCSHKCCQ